MTFGRTRVSLLVAILSVACLAVAMAVFALLYGVVLDAQKQRLQETSRPCQSGMLKI